MIGRKIYRCPLIGLFLLIALSGNAQAQLSVTITQTLLDGDSIRVLFRARCPQYQKVEAHEIELTESNISVNAFNLQYYDTVPGLVSVAVVVNIPSTNTYIDLNGILTTLAEYITLKQNLVADFTVFGAHTVSPSVTRFNGDSLQFANDLMNNITAGTSYLYNAVNAAVQHLAGKETTRRYLFVISSAFDEGSSVEVDNLFRDIKGYGIDCAFGTIQNAALRLQATWLANNTMGRMTTVYSHQDLPVVLDQQVLQSQYDVHLNILTYLRMSSDSGHSYEIGLKVDKCNTSASQQHIYTTVDRTVRNNRNPIGLYVEVPNKISGQEYEIPIYIDDANLQRKIREPFFALIKVNPTKVRLTNMSTSPANPRTLFTGMNNSAGTYEGYTAMSLNKASIDTTASILAFLRFDVFGSIEPGVPFIERFVLYSSDGRHIWNTNIFEFNTSQGFHIIPNISLPTCETRAVTFTAEDGYNEYFWSTGEEGKSIVVHEQGPIFCYALDQYGVKRYSDTITVAYRLPPEPFLNLTRDTLVCGDGSIILATTEPFFQYHWSTGELGRSIEVRKGASYWVEVTDQLGCKGRTPSVNIQVMEKPDIVLYSFPGLQVCEPDIVQLQVFAHDAVSYTWSTMEDTDQIEVSVTGDYYATVTDNNGCSYNSDTIHVEILSKPEALIEGEPSACYNTVQNYTVRNANPAHDYIWSAIGGIVIDGQGTPEAEILWLNASYGTVKVNEDNGSCDEKSTKDIILKPFEIPIIEIDGITELCAGDTVTLRSAKQYDHYYWSNGITKRSITVTTAGAYSLSIQNDGGCEGATDPVVITMHPNPQIPVISMNGTTLVAPEASEYFWYLDGLLLALEKGRVLQIRKNGTYKLRVVSEYGCTSESEDYEVSIIGVEEPANPRTFSVTVYPTTTRDIVNILLHVSYLTDVQIEVFDVLGREVREEHFKDMLGNQVVPMNIGRLPGGLYYILVKTKYDFVTETVMKVIN